MGQHVCTICGYLYDPERGDVDNGIPPGTPFSDLPGDWASPVCGAGKSAFEVANRGPSEQESTDEGGPARLRLTTYSDEDQTLVLTCTVEPHEHVAGWEIARLDEILLAGGLDDGRVVKAVRVIFPDEASARQEMRPLLKVGIRVEYMDEEGEFARLR